MDACFDGSGVRGEAGSDRVARGRGGGEHPDRGPGRLDSDHGAGLAGSLQSKGLAGLADAPRSGRPRQLDHRAIVTETLRPPPKKLGVTHWSSRLLAERLKISHKSVTRAWRAYGIKPWKAESFRFSTDPELVGKVTDICGLYLAPPENAIVLCVDEKSQIQALDRTVPILPMQEGRIERDVLDPDGQPVQLHLVMDNYAAHKHANVKAWLAENARFVVHFTPTHASWMNLVEIWFGIVERQAIRRGVFKSVNDLNAKIRAFIEGWHDRAHPFVWTKTAEEILAKANRPTTSNPRH